MKRFTTILILFFLAQFAIANSSPDVWTSSIIYPLGESSETFVEKNTRVEIGISVPEWLKNQINAFLDKKDGQTYNPFDPEWLDVEAVFMHSESGDLSDKKFDIVRKTYGFCYRGYSRQRESRTDPTYTKWTYLPDDFQFRVRFAPEKSGKWKCKLVFKVRGEVHHSTEDIYFTATESEALGPIGLSNGKGAQQQYLRFTENNSAYFPVGMNLLWTDLLRLSPAHYSTYEKWISQLHAVNANYIQLSSLPFTHGIEWEVPGDYSNRLTHAFEMDELLQLADDRGIYVNLLTLIHDEFLDSKNMWIHDNNHWTHNGYNAAVNKGLTNANTQLEFFTDDKSKKLFKRRLRYLLSRYGYSTKLAIIELLSEVDNAIPGYNDKTAEGEKKRAAFKAWFIEMKKYIQDELGFSNKLVSASYTQSHQHLDINKSIFPDADLVLLHFYGRHNSTNFKNRYGHVQAFRKNASTKNKPVLFDEMGANVFPGIESCTDITFHNNLWATSMMGCFGAGQNWWWDNALLKNGYEKNLKGISLFLQEEDFHQNGMIATATTEKKQKYKSKTKFEIFYLTSSDKNKVTGWAHNTSYIWANQKNSNECVATMVKNNNGSHIEAADNTQYAKEYKDMNSSGEFRVYNDAKFKLVLAPNTEYLIKWYNTVSGELTSLQEQLKSNGSGKIQFKIPNEINQQSYGDFGFKVVKYSK